MKHINYYFVKLEPLNRIRHGSDFLVDCKNDPTKKYKNGVGVIWINFEMALIDI